MENNAKTTNTGMDVLGRQQSNSNTNSKNAVLYVHLDHPILLEDISYKTGCILKTAKPQQQEQQGMFVTMNHPLSTENAKDMDVLE